MQDESTLRRSKRKSAGIGSYETTVQADVNQRWVSLAKAARDGITVTKLAKGGSYDVEAKLTHKKDGTISKGAYDSSTGIHAEIGAFENCLHPRTDMTLSVNPPPCKRCAVIVRIYMRTYEMKLNAPEMGFAATYSGAYTLTGKLITLLIQDLIDAGVMSREQSAMYFDKILSDFCGGTWIDLIK